MSVWKLCADDLVKPCVYSQVFQMFAQCLSVDNFWCITIDITFWIQHWNKTYSIADYRSAYQNYCLPIWLVDWQWELAANFHSNCHYSACWNSEFSSLYRSTFCQSVLIHHCPVSSHSTPGHPRRPTHISAVRFSKHRGPCTVNSAFCTATGHRSAVGFWLTQAVNSLCINH